jgi:hypothetical protein
MWKLMTLLTQQKHEHEFCQSLAEKLLGVSAQAKSARWLTPGNRYLESGKTS